MSPAVPVPRLARRQALPYSNISERNLSCRPALHLHPLSPLCWLESTYTFPRPTGRNSSNGSAKGAQCIGPERRWPGGQQCCWPPLPSLPALPPVES